ncbi:MAG: hypothetical protein IIB38_08100 [Candidatus Hydrogenedentes bacterium]|nr:hypothetical protein [Candidatus Hydrogenedentota bacterium]
MKEYFKNLPVGVKRMIIAFFIAIFAYFGYDVIFTEEAPATLEQVEIVLEEMVLNE